MGGQGGPESTEQLERMFEFSMDLMTSNDG